MIQHEQHARAVERMLRERIIAVLRFSAPDECLSAAAAIAAGGVGVLEVTLTTPGALDVVRSLATRDDVLVGVGSVLTVSDLEGAADAGARFYASPATDAAILSRALALGMAALPGALTPTEILTAWRGGADIVKVFPMPADGAAYLRALAAPLPKVRLAPSGGVTDSSAPGLLRAGAAALNVGSWLTHDAGAPAPVATVRERAEALRRVVG